MNSKNTNNSGHPQLIAFTTNISLNKGAHTGSITGYAVVQPGERYTAAVFSAAEDTDYGDGDIFSGIDASSINHIIIPNNVLIETLYNFKSKQ